MGEKKSPGLGYCCTYKVNQKNLLQKDRDAPAILQMSLNLIALNGTLCRYFW